MGRICSQWLLLPPASQARMHNVLLRHGRSRSAGIVLTPRYAWEASQRLRLLTWSGLQQRHIQLETKVNNKIRNKRFINRVGFLWGIFVEKTDKLRDLVLHFTIITVAPRLICWCPSRVSSLRDLHHSPRVSVRIFSISNEWKSEILRTGTLPIPFAHCRGKCCKVMIVLVILVERCQGFGCRLRMRTSDSPTRQGHARWKVIDHQWSARSLNRDCLLASVSLCLVLRNFSARFRWLRRAGGTFAIAPEPFQGILRPRLP
jgi:hypothetical protein